MKTAGTRHLAEPLRREERLGSPAPAPLMPTPARKDTGTDEEDRFRRALQLDVSSGKDDDGAWPDTDSDTPEIHASEPALPLAKTPARLRRRTPWCEAPLAIAGEASGHARQRAADLRVIAAAVTRLWAGASEGGRAVHAQLDAFEPGGLTLTVIDEPSALRVRLACSARALHERLGGARDTLATTLAARLGRFVALTVTLAGHPRADLEACAECSQ